MLPLLPIKAGTAEVFGYLHSEAGIKRFYANLQKLPLLEISLAVAMVVHVMSQPMAKSAEGQGK